MIYQCAECQLNIIFCGYVNEFALENYLKELPETYETYTYEEWDWGTGWNDGEICTIHQITLPLSVADVEVNALTTAALKKMQAFNAKQIQDQIPPTLSAASEKLSIMSRREEKNVSMTEQPSTFFDLLTKIMFISSGDSQPTPYAGLSRLKADLSFIESLNKNAQEWIQESKLPERMRETVAYKIAATSRQVSRWSLFVRPQTQNRLDKMITDEIKKRKNVPGTIPGIIIPSAPPREVIAIATPVINAFTGSLTDDNKQPQFF